MASFAVTQENTQGMVVQPADLKMIRCTQFCALCFVFESVTKRGKAGMLQIVISSDDGGDKTIYHTRVRT